MPGESRSEFKDCRQTVGKRPQSVEVHSNCRVAKSVFSVFIFILHVLQVLRHLKTLAVNEEQANQRRLSLERGELLKYNIYFNFKKYVLAVSSAIVN